MRWPLVWRSNAEAELAGAHAEAARQRELRVEAARTARTEVIARREITDLYNVLSDDHDEAVRRNQSLCTQLDELKDAAGIQAEARRSAERIARLQKAVVRARKEAAEERGSRTAMERQWDEVFGLNNDPEIDKGASWQERREGMRFDKPTTEEATA